jgi:hypothetical protein
MDQTQGCLPLHPLLRLFLGAFDRVSPQRQPHKVQSMATGSTHLSRPKGEIMTKRTKAEASEMVDRLIDAIVEKENADDRARRTAATLEFMDARAALIRALSEE